MIRTPLHIIETMFVQLNGHKDFHWTVLDSDETVSNIIGGHIDGQIIEITEVSRDEKTCRDVTEDVAREVLMATDGDRSWELRSFIHAHVGVHACA